LASEPIFNTPVKNMRKLSEDSVDSRKMSRFIDLELTGEERPLEYGQEYEEIIQ